MTIAVAAPRRVSVGALAFAHLGVVFALTSLSPMWLLLLAPLLLGVPHVAADLRYLVLRLPGGIERGPALAMGLPLAGLLALRAAAVAGAATLPLVEVALGLAAVAGGLLGRGARARRALAVVVLAALAAFALSGPGFTALALAHLHNLVALGFFVAWSRGRTRPGTGALFLATFAALSGAIAVGALDSTIASLAGLASPVPGFDLDGMVRTLAPGMGPTMGARVVVLFAFAQAMHYSVWVHLLPASASLDGDRDAGANGLAGWKHDFGAWGWRILVAAAVLLPLLGLVDAAGTRASYLSLVLFHGWLEIAVAAHLFVRGRRRG